MSNETNESNAIFEYWCKKCEETFYLKNEPKETVKRFVCCPLCKDFTKVTAEGEFYIW